eukprot:SAG11_NODE_310_length_10927_cov_19.887514_4_plen_164_part_00
MKQQTESSPSWWLISNLSSSDTASQLSLPPVGPATVALEAAPTAGLSDASASAFTFASRGVLSGAAAGVSASASASVAASVAAAAAASVAAAAAAAGPDADADAAVLDDGLGGGESHKANCSPCTASRSCNGGQRQSRAWVRLRQRGFCTAILVVAARRADGA